LPQEPVHQRHEQQDHDEPEDGDRRRIAEIELFQLKARL
jgi:hypothetical protein